MENEKIDVKKISTSITNKTIDVVDALFYVLHITDDDSIEHLLLRLKLHIFLTSLLNAVRDIDLIIKRLKQDKNNTVNINDLLFMKADLLRLQGKAKEAVNVLSEISTNTHREDDKKKFLISYLSSP